MFKIKKIIPIFILAFITITAIANTTEILTGNVVDSRNEAPLYGANVMIRGTLLGSSTNAAGHFRVENLPPGKYRVEVSMMGYEIVTREVVILTGQTESIDIKLDQTILVQPNILVTASKRKQHIEDAPTSVDVISMREIQARNVTNLDEMLQNVSGFRVIDGQIDLRGSTGFNWAAGSRVLLLIDGHPMINGDSGGINWDIIPVEEISRVEIVKGAGSALYGSNAMAGMVNIITHDPQEIPKTRLRLTWGVYDEPVYESWRWSDRFLTHRISKGDWNLSDVLSYNSIDISHSRQIGRVGILGSWGRKTSTGYHENGDYARNQIFLKSKIRLSNQQTLTLSANWASNDHGDFIQWESPNNPLVVPDEERGYRILYNKGSIHATFQQAINKYLAYSIKTNWYRTDWENNFENSDYAITDRLGTEGQVDLLLGRHAITAGTELAANHAKSKIYGNQDTRDIAFYCEDAMTLSPQWALTSGVRFDYHHVAGVSSDRQLSPRAGMVYKPRKGTSIRTSVGYGFRAPSIAEVFANTKVSGVTVVPNLDLKTAERGVNAEIGIHQILFLTARRPAGFFNNPLSFIGHYLQPIITCDASVFINNLNNMIDVDYNPQLEAYQFMNLGRARIRGIELKCKATFFGGLFDAHIGATFLDPINLDTQKTLKYRAKQHIVFGNTLHYKKWTLGMDYRYASRVEEIIHVLGSEFDERVPMHVMDVRLITDMGKISIGLEGKNIFNYQYTLRQRFLEPIRHYVVTLRGTF